MFWSTPEVRQLNKERIRREIRMHTKCTKASIASATSLSVATCNTAFNEMLRQGELIYADREEAHMGRPAKQFAYNPDYCHFMGIYAKTYSGINTVEYAVSDSLGNLILREKFHPEKITCEMITDVVSRAVKADELIKCLSFGFPGVADGGIIEYCDIAELTGVDFEAGIKRIADIDIEMRNEMDFISYGVQHASASKSAGLAAVYFPMDGIGCVGCGFIADGKVVSGSSRFSGELSYALEAFGMSRQEQLEAFTDNERFCQIAAKILMMIICTMDPEEAVLIGKGINEKHLAEIRRLCEGFISDKHIPHMSAEDDADDDYISGLIHMAINKHNFPLSQPI